MKEYVNLSIINGIGTIEFFHYQSNSLPSNILNKIAEKIEEAGMNTDIKVILLKSGGDRVFCAGASFDELISINNLEDGKRFFSGFAKVINAARKCPKFIIGRVQGKTVGGGVGMAASTDYCFATKFASAKLSELAIGIGPFVVGPAVERKIGKSAFSEMSINSSKWFDANWSQNKGLYNEIFDNNDDMDQAISEILVKLSEFSPEAMKNLKTILWEGTEGWDKLLMERSIISGNLVLTKYTKDYIKKFKKNDK
tara:strand:+ start:4943 stop:5704 length:762 start_codon:yes stop_codon:yes gene_type:complete